MSREQRLRVLEQREEGPMHIYVTANGVTTDPATGESMPSETWRSLHPDAATFTLRIARAGAPED